MVTMPKAEKDRQCADALPVLLEMFFEMRDTGCSRVATQHKARKVHGEGYRMRDTGYEMRGLGVWQTHVLSCTVSGLYTLNEVVEFPT